MKRFVSLAGALLLAGALMACGAGAGRGIRPPNGGQLRAEQSFALRKGSSGLLRPGSDEPGSPADGGAGVRHNPDSGAEEGYEPTVRLLEKRDFEFSAFCYDGTVRLTGTYTEEEDAYLLKPEATSAPEGAVGSELTEIRLEKAEGACSIPAAPWGHL